MDTKTIQNLVDNDTIDLHKMRQFLAQLRDDTGANDEERKLAALALHEQCYPEEITTDASSFCVYGREYLIVSEAEADELAKESILDSLWAFRPEYLAKATGLDVDVFTALSGLCENAQSAVLSLVKANCDLDEFVADVIDQDGRAHFLASYDGNEHECGEFLIYRVN